MAENVEKNLDLLGVFHYILGALTALFACLPLIHLFIGIAILTTGLDSTEQAPRMVGLIFVILAGFIVLMGWALAVLIIIAGRRLQQRRAYNYCLVIAFLECLIVPLGTVLGIFTITTLTGEPARNLFAQGGMQGVEKDQD